MNEFEGFLKNAFAISKHEHQNQSQTINTPHLYKSNVYIYIYMQCNIAYCPHRIFGETHRISYICKRYMYFLSYTVAWSIYLSITLL